uniref:Putative secreted protein n=1 Tax=Ixodes ricinus TaxID=34613 RepID=A0A6B0UET8_IXORI
MMAWATCWPTRAAVPAVTTWAPPALVSTTVAVSGAAATCTTRYVTPPWPFSVRNWYWMPGSSSVCGDTLAMAAAAWPSTSTPSVIVSTDWDCRRNF